MPFEDFSSKRFVPLSPHEGKTYLTRQRSVAPVGSGDPNARKISSEDIVNYETRLLEGRRENFKNSGITGGISNNTLSALFVVAAGTPSNPAVWEESTGVITSYSSSINYEGSHSTERAENALTCTHGALLAIREGMGARKQNAEPESRGGGYHIAVSHSEVNFMSNPKVSEQAGKEVKSLLNRMNHRPRNIGEKITSVDMICQSYPNTMCNNYCRDALNYVGWSYLNNLYRGLNGSGWKDYISDKVSFRVITLSKVIFQPSTDDKNAWTTEEQGDLNIPRGHGLEVQYYHLAPTDWKKDRKTVIKADPEMRLKNMGRRSYGKAPRANSTKGKNRYSPVGR